MNERPALSRIGIIEAAVRVADRGGLTAVSMRNVGKELGVEAMSLYHHIANKAELLDGLADWIFAGIVLPGPGEPWRQAMFHRATSARNVLARHPWALTLIESRRSPGPSLLRHHDAVLGCLRRGGFSVAAAASANSLLDSYVFGFRAGAAAACEGRLRGKPSSNSGDWSGALAAALPWFHQSGGARTASRWPWRPTPSRSSTHMCTASCSPN